MWASGKITSRTAPLESDVDVVAVGARPPVCDPAGAEDFNEDARRGRLRSWETVGHRGRRARRTESRECSSRSRRRASATPTSSRARAAIRRAFPAIFGHEGAGVVVDVGAGVTSVKKGDQRHPALHTRVPRVQIVPQSQDEPLHGDSRDAGKGVMPTARAASRSARRRSTTTWGARRSRSTRCSPRSRSRRCGATPRSTRFATSDAA